MGSNGCSFKCYKRIKKQLLSLQLLNKKNISSIKKKSKTNPWLKKSTEKIIKKNDFQSSKYLRVKK